MKTRTSFQRTLTSGANESTNVSTLRSRDIHPYTKPIFWTNPGSWFWETPLHSERSKEYFRAFVAEQAKLADRKHK